MTLLLQRPRSASPSGLRLGRALISLMFIAVHTAAAQWMDVQPIPLASSETILVPSHPSASVDTQRFLAGGFRITTQGHVIDTEPVVPRDFRAVPAPGGWLLLQQDGDRVVVHQLFASGPPIRRHTLLPHGNLLDVAGDGTTAVAVIGSSIVHFDSQKTLNVHTIGNHLQTEVERTSTGYALVTTRLADPVNTIVHLWTLSGSGVPETIVEVTRARTVSRLMTAEDRIFLSTFSRFGPELFVFDDSLVRRGYFLNFSARDAVKVSNSYVIHLHSTASKDRIVTLDPQAIVLRDEEGEPLVSRATIGSTHLVVRPWGDVAIAENDPRTVVGPIFRLRGPKRETFLLGPRQTAGDGSTLVVVVREAAHELILIRPDGSSKKIETFDRRAIAVAATPEEFVVARSGADGGNVRRLSFDGRWIDAENDPLHRLPSSAGPVALEWIADDRLMAAYALGFERFAVAVLSRTARNGSISERTFDFPTTAFAISKGLSNTLILAQGQTHCGITCPGFDPKVTMLVLDASGDLVAQPVQSSSGTAPAGAYAKPSGGWIVPLLNGAGGELAEVTERGGLSYIPAISIGAIDSTGRGLDLESSSTGFRLLHPMSRNVLHYDASGMLRSIEGLPQLSDAKFAGSRHVVVTGTSTLFSAGTTKRTYDLALEVYARSPNGELTFQVPNRGSTVAYDVRIETLAGPFRSVPVPFPISPGQVATIAAPDDFLRPNGRYRVTALGVDGTPNDNVSSAVAAQPAEPRRRGR